MGTAIPATLETRVTIVEPILLRIVTLPLAVVVRQVLVGHQEVAVVAVAGQLVVATTIN